MMAIDYKRLQNVTFREIISALTRDNFALDRQSHSHELYQDPRGRRVTISAHSPWEIIPKKILKWIIEDQARWTEEDLKRLQLLH